MSATITALWTGTLTVQHANTSAGFTASSMPTITTTKSYDSTAVTKQYTATRTSSGETLDVTSGLTDAFGTAVSFTTVKAILIKNNDTGSVTVTVGGGTNGLINALPAIPPGEVAFIPCSLTTSGSAKNVVMSSSAGSVSYTISILGT